MSKKVLIVDDEHDWVKMLLIRLAHAGYQIETAFDALQCMTQANKFLPDLIVLDIQMPAGGGINALKNLKNSMKTFNIPVIISTARSDAETRQEVEKMGIAGFFLKSTDVSNLLDQIQGVLGT